MNRLGVLILSVLNREEAASGISAMSAYEVAEQMNDVYRADTIYKTMVKLNKAGYIKCGLKDGKANTYFITQSGQNALEDARKAV